jgi:hypothetical protein
VQHILGNGLALMLKQRRIVTEHLFEPGDDGMCLSH